MYLQPPITADRYRRMALIFAASFGALGIALGAFGAHWLKPILTAEKLAIWHTAVEYQLYHSTAFLALGLAGRTCSGMRYSVYCWGAGVVLFSGSLYLLVLLQRPLFGVLTPVGGLLLVAGWICLLFIKNMNQEMAED